MTQDNPPAVPAVPSISRPPLPPDAGVHSLQLDIDQTRDELAATLDDLFATFNPAVQIRSHPVLFASLFLAAVAAATGAVLTFRRGRARARR
ncbi:DUF3618 domain-containing protein [Diaminobutyricibacter tongyongensis]|uniref:DUF3618 domain-containing protein n=1 Tax=Leifsonia tongyongensis TaxID=1268043 RepID=A0A6L9XVQ3_9MICO|nr:DUF3618 domain-containing protein [Diaminobutyricibacter tongyongensis]